MQGPTKNHKCNKHKKCILNYDSVNLFFTFFKYIYLWEINYNNYNMGRQQRKRKLIVSKIKMAKGRKH